MKREEVRRALASDEQASFVEHLIGQGYGHLFQDFERYQAATTPGGGEARRRTGIGSGLSDSDLEEIGGEVTANLTSYLRQTFNFDEQEAEKVALQIAFARRDDSVSGPVHHSVMAAYYDSLNDSNGNGHLGGNGNGHDESGYGGLASVVRSLITPRVSMPPRKRGPYAESSIPLGLVNTSIFEPNVNNS